MLVEEFNSFLRQRLDLRHSLPIEELSGFPATLVNLFVLVRSKSPTPGLMPLDGKVISSKSCEQLQFAPKPSESSRTNRDQRHALNDSLSLSRYRSYDGCRLAVLSVMEGADTGTNQGQFLQGPCGGGEQIQE